jgi:hypothetical protein
MPEAVGVPEVSRALLLVRGLVDAVGVQGGGGSHHGTAGASKTAAAAAAGRQL